MTTIGLRRPTSARQTGPVPNAVDRWVPGQRLEVRASRKRWLGVAAICLVFSAIGIGMIADDRPIGWVLLIVFGLGLPVCAWQLVRPSTLVVDATGVTLHHMTRVHRWEFADVGAFTIWRNPARRSRQRLVTFEHGPTADGAVSRMSRALGAGDATLPDTYGMSVEALADVLNRARAAALGATGPGAWAPPVP